MKPITLVGHKHNCPRHGEGEVVSGDPGTSVDGHAVACLVDRICCGAISELDLKADQLLVSETQQAMAAH